jgi:hypothetical protein
LSLEWLVKLRLSKLLSILLRLIEPLFFALEQVSVSVDFQVERRLDVHQFLVASEVVSHLRLEVLNLVLQGTDLVLERRKNS